MSKPKLFVDVDGVIIDSVSAICKTYNYLYQHYADFVAADPTKVKTWNMKEIIPLCTNVENLFSSNLFFEYAELMPNAKEVLLSLSDKYDIHIISIGTPLNIAQKALYLREKLPFIKNMIFISNDGCVMNKDKIVMDNGIMIDDNQDNLTNPTCSLPIVFGKKYEWNEKFQGIRCLDWLAVRDLLIGHIE